MNSQTVFGWFEDGLTTSVVRSLCVWKPEVIKAVGHDGSRVCGGQQNAVAYSTWLKFFSPLSASWVSVVG